VVFEYITYNRHLYGIYIFSIVDIYVGALMASIIGVVGRLYSW
jgi:hypothetical protein